MEMIFFFTLSDKKEWNNRWKARLTFQSKFFFFKTKFDTLLQRIQRRCYMMTTDYPSQPFNPFLNQEFISLQRRKHGRDVFEGDFLDDLFGLDVGILVLDEERSVAVVPPSVARDPLMQSRSVHAAQQLPQFLLLNVLIRDVDHVTNVFPHLIPKSVDAKSVDEFLVAFQRRPERLELTRLQQRGVVEDASEWILLAVQPSRLDQAFAHDQVRVREIRQRLKQDLPDGELVVISGVELVQFENGEVGLEVVGDFLRLRVDVGLQSGEMLGIVSVDAAKQIRHLSTHRLRVRHFVLSFFFFAFLKV